MTERYFTTPKMENRTTMKSEKPLMYGQSVQITVPQDQPKVRLDVFLHEQFPAYSRSFFNRAIIDGLVQVNGALVTKTGFMIAPHTTICLTFPAKREVSAQMVERADIPIEKIAEHEHFMIINKPAGLLVHPTTSTSNEITLMDWLLCNVEQIAEVGCIARPGIIHRLDKLTSGLMIIPRTNYAYTQFGMMFRERTLNKTYLALVQGHPPRQGTIDLSIARHHIERNRMTTVAKDEPVRMKTRHAVTHYTVERYFADAALVRVTLETGRTHQIRVHMAAIGHPVIGDVLYGTKSPLIARQALHAYELAFQFDGEQFTFVAPLPEDMRALIAQLEQA
jgi:23S rRNA pseudouridine1911/1915/1917 synthase